MLGHHRHRSRQFNIAHNIAADDDGWVYVADRENHRVQVFDGNGKYEMQWNNMHRPCALYCCAGGGKNPNIIGSWGGHAGQRQAHQHRPAARHRRQEGRPDRPPGREHSPAETGSSVAAGLAVDSKGDIYVGEVSYTNWAGTHPGVPVQYLRSLQKLEKVH